MAPCSLRHFSVRIVILRPTGGSRPRALVRENSCNSPKPQTELTVVCWCCGKWNANLNRQRTYPTSVVQSPPSRRYSARGRLPHPLHRVAKGGHKEADSRVCTLFRNIIPAGDAPSRPEHCHVRADTCGTLIELQRPFTRLMIEPTIQRSAAPRNPPSPRATTPAGLATRGSCGCWCRCSTTARS